jgi:peptidoglycan/LPS O-acetylase OafA/YrhL
MVLNMSSHSLISISYLSHISKYRTEIMGYAILGVMLAHIKTIGSFPDTIITKIIGFLCYSVFTGGFLFLSGLGLYSSLYHHCVIKDFYKKRAIRLLVPYLLISTPYFLYTDLVVGNDFTAFIGHVSTISFWLHGNYSGMWYIAASVLFYFLYPLFHRYIYSSKTESGIVLLIVMAVWCMILFVLKQYTFQFYDKTSVALNKFPLFLTGSWFMSCIISKKKIQTTRDWLGIVLGGAFLFLANGIWSLINVISICFCGIIFSKMNASNLFNIVRSVFHWLGTYSLELYIIHLLVFYTPVRDKIRV